MNKGISRSSDVDNSEKINIFHAILCISFLIVFLSINVFVFKDATLDGSNQIVLLIAAAFTAVVGVSRGVKWDAIFNGMLSSLTVALPSLIILLLVGALSGAWMVSGIVPAVIYYGLQILNPSIFFTATCITCAAISLATGSSWTTAGTVGIALIAIAKTMGLNEGLAAGAILSGAYFGDKISPLSDTTNLAPAIAGTDLFTHIRYMVITTVPSILMALILFAFMDFSADVVISENINGVTEALTSTFTFSPLLLIPPGLVIFLIIKKFPPSSVLFIGAIAGVVIGLITQYDIIYALGSNKTNVFTALFSGAMLSLYGDVTIATSNSLANELLSSGGMAGMLNTVWLILTAMIFGGVMEATGMLKVLSNLIMSRIKTDTGLVASTALSCVGFNILASDQYLSIVVPGRIYRSTYEERGLSAENLSRTLEDTGTVTSVLVPWNTCGAFHANILGVSTLNYLPYCYFNLISPVMTIIISAIGYKIKKTLQPAN